MVQVMLRRQCNHCATGNILCQSCDLVGESGHVLLANVGQQQIDQIGAGCGLVAFCRTGDAAGIEGFIQVHHFNQLVLDVGSLGCTVKVGSNGSSTDQNIAYTDFTATVALTVITGKTLHQQAAELVLTTHENIFVRNENIVKDHQRFVTAELAVTHIKISAFHFTSVAGLAAIDVVNAFRIRRSNERNRIVGIFLGHGDGRHNQNPV